MKYMILIYGSTEAWARLDADALSALDAVHRDLQAELTASGELVETDELRPEGSKVVRKRDGIAQVSDGPFAQAMQFVAGYYVLECTGIDRATEIAGRLVEAEFAPIEVRAIGETAG